MIPSFCWIEADAVGLLAEAAPAEGRESWPMVKRPGISASDAAFYRENGYLIVEDFIDPESVARIKAEGTALCRGDRGPIEGLVHAAPDDDEETVLARYVTCHHVHKSSPFLTAFMTDERIVEAVGVLVGENVKGFASQFFIKHAGMPGNAWHQDENFVPTRDRSLCTSWIALDEATEENGCLWMIPGSHASGVLYPMRPHNNPMLDRAEECYDFPGLETAVPIVLRPGSCVFFSGYILHSSTTNRRRSGSRRALLYPFARAETPLAYAAKNEPVSNYHDMRDFVLVRGSDPYRWKARTEEMRALLRAPGPMVEDVALSDMREREKVGA
jgi:phytanoyl-CoA hydroxylase